MPPTPLLLAIALIGCAPSSRPATTNAAAPEPRPTTNARPLATAPAPAPAPVDELPPWLERPRRRVVTTTSITILDGLRFIGATTKVDASSLPLLDAIAKTLDANPDITLLEVRAFANDAPATERQRLAEARAGALVNHLVQLGVARERLIARGVATSASSSGEPTFSIVARGGGP